MWPNLEMDSSRKVLAEKLKSALATQQGAQVGLARRAGVGQGSVSRAASGAVGVTLDTLDALAAALKRAPWDLLRPGSADEQTMTGTERELLARFRACDPTGQGKILTYAADQAALHRPPKAADPPAEASAQRPTTGGGRQKREATN